MPTTQLNQETLALLQSLEADQPGSLARLIRLFVADAPSLLSRIEIAIERRDQVELRNASHYLRSAALALGAEDLAKVAQDIEHWEMHQFGTEASAARLGDLRQALRDAVLALLQHTTEL